DICTVPAAGVVGEAVIAYEMANVLIEKFGGDTLDEMKRNFEAYQAYVRSF
ncbi:MAG: chorismate synthase, partial [Nitrospirota bacterium]|nr:chorismate synthase [Nitrospirota bacterium]